MSSTVDSNLYVSLTTIPSRLSSIWKTIDSLLAQTVKPTQIVVNIPRQYTLRFLRETVNEDLIQLLVDKYSTNPTVVIHRTDRDNGPGTKLIGFLIWKQSQDSQSPVHDDNSFVVLTDDDVIYKPDFLSGFLPTLPSCMASSYCVNTYPVKRADGTSYNFVAGQGRDGFVIQLPCLFAFIHYYNIIISSRTINLLDDFYISFYLLLQNIPIKRVGNGELVYESHTDIDSLQYLPGEFSRDNIIKRTISLLTCYFLDKTVNDEDITRS
jgi:hypothetical protein